MYEGREIYANPPLEYVATEVRYPYAPRLRQPEVLDGVLIALAHRFPRPAPAMALGGYNVGLAPQVETVTRAFNKAHTWAVTVMPTAITIETTMYAEFDGLRLVVEECLDALVRHAKIAAVERVGLRYVNEFRIPSPVESLHAYRGWIADRLIDHMDLAGGLTPSATQGVVQYEAPGAQGMIARFGASLTGVGVIGDEPLRRRKGLVEGPYFALDIDSFWHPPVEDAPDFDTSVILGMLDELHRPIGSTFQNAITEQLREGVLRRTVSA